MFGRVLLIDLLAALERRVIIDEEAVEFFIDALTLRSEGVTDLLPYSVDPAKEAVLDFFLDAPVSSNVRKATFHAG